VKATYLDVELEKNTEWFFETQSDETLFVYIFEGDATFGSQKPETVAEKHAVLFSEGTRLSVKTAEAEIRFLLLEGKPLKEPVAWGGPIVMNTQEELELAFKELSENKFIK